ncbi:hypothetical protein Gogos_000925 [Gossypium gossypioides]|uniref:Uncharacterized protein n=1 Tax=Gossypium gossypioides TaxID=34282 RepID=A0A7J9CUA6_GOSGO|nr:hypothetical protein [Gossypium gossypioides]
MQYPIIDVAKARMFIGWGSDPCEYKMEDTIMKVGVRVAFKIGVGVKRPNKVVIARNPNLETFKPTPIVELVESDVWGTISDQRVVTHIIGGNFVLISITINGWLHDFLWAQASQENLTVNATKNLFWGYS